MEEDKKVKYDPELEILSLTKKLNETEAMLSRLKEVIVDNQLQDEVDFSCSSTEEVLCINGINHIAKLVEAHDYDKNDIASFEKLFNILRAIRGKEASGNKKIKDKEVAELLSIVGEQK